MTETAKGHAELVGRAASVICEVGALCGWPEPDCKSTEAAEALYAAGLLSTPIAAHGAGAVTEADLPAHPEDFRYAALLRNHDYKRSRWVVVPEGQSLEMAETGSARPWLKPYLGTDWHLFGFVSLATPRKELKNDVS